MCILIIMFYLFYSMGYPHDFLQIKRREAYVTSKPIHRPRHPNKTEGILVTIHTGTHNSKPFQSCTSFRVARVNPCDHNRATHVIRK